MFGNAARSLTVNLVLAALWGCGGGGGSGDDAPPPELSVNATTPADGATSVDVESTFVADFSAPLDATSLAQNLKLAAGTAEVAGNVAVAGTRATFIPTKPLALSTPYTATIDSGVKGSGGEMLATAQSIRFTTRDGAWRGATTIASPPASVVSTPQLAADPDGNALVVWAQHPFPTGTTTVVASRHDARSGEWSAPQGVASHPSFAEIGAVAANDAGNGIAIWQADDPGPQIYVSRFTAASNAWDGVQSIGTEEMCCHIAKMRATIDAGGNALAAWSTSSTIDGFLGTVGIPDLWVRRYNAAMGTWGEPLKISGVYDFDLATDKSGRAVLIWRTGSESGLESSIWARRSGASGEGWGEAQSLNDTPGGTAERVTEPKIAMDSSGNALAVWVQNGHVLGRHFNIGTGTWGAVRTIGGDGVRGAGNLSVALKAGNAGVAWLQCTDDTSERCRVQSNRYAAETDNWGQPHQIAQEGAGAILFPQMTVDAAGNGIVLWQHSQDGPLWNIFARRYAASTGAWGPIGLIGTDVEFVWGPRLVSDDRGSAHAAWRQPGRIVANRFK